MEPLSVDDILHEGVLEIRANRGVVGLRRWLSRYFVICKKDWTLRRYTSAKDVENPSYVPRCYFLKNIDFVRAVRTFNTLRVFFSHFVRSAL